MTVTLASFIGPEGTEGFLGLNALKRAQESGMSKSEILKKLETEGLKLGDKAKAALSED
jgi:hypothetical protein